MQITCVIFFVICLLNACLFLINGRIFCIPNSKGRSLSVRLSPSYLYERCVAEYFHQLKGGISKVCSTSSLSVMTTIAIYVI